MIEWIKPKLWIIFAVVATVVIGYMVLQFIECRKRGKAAGKPYKCPLFGSQPTSILPIDEYYDLRQGECYHYLDFGDRMSVRRVGMENCN